MSESVADLRFEAPASLAEGEQQRQDLNQEVAEIQAALGEHKKHEPKGPGAKRSDAGQEWLRRRASLTAKLRRLNQHQAFVKQWLKIERGRQAVRSALTPSQALHQEAYRVEQLERALMAARVFLDDDCDENFDGLEAAVEEAERWLRKEEVEDGNSIDAD